MNYSVIRKIAMAIFIVVIVLLVLFVGREIAVRFFDYQPPAITESQQKKSSQVEFVQESGEKFYHTVTDNYIYFVNTDKVSICDAEGDLKKEESIVTSEPVVKRNGEYVVIGDIGRNNIYVFSGTELKNTVKTKKPIIDVSVNNSGYLVVITEGDMHKCDVTVLDTKGKEQFIWNSGNLFVLNASIADNNKNIIISTLDTSGGKMKSVLSFYNISNEKPIATEEYENELISAVSIHGTKAFCIGDSKTVIYRVSGEKTNEILYNGKTLTTFKTWNSKIVMAFSESALSGKRYNIETYNTSGKNVGTYETDYEIKYLDFLQDMVVVSRGGLIDIIDVSGREKRLIDPGVDIKSLSFMGKTSSAVGFTVNGAYIIRLS